MKPTNRSRRALIVDDEMTNRLILRSLLKKQGYETAEAEDGRQAVELFDKFRPGIVFMDIMMPEMNGYDATRLIKQKSGTEFIPVIFLTAMSDEDALQACIDVGGDDFLVKPYDKFILQSKIQAMERIANLNREVSGMYSLIHREQEIAEQVFVNAVQMGNIKSPHVRSVIRPASTFSGDMILSEYSPSRDLCLLIGDFTGHGLSSALGAMPVSEVFRAMTAKGFDPEDILEGINKKLRQFLPVGMFLGMILIRVNHELDQVTVFNAGMPPMLIVDGESGQIKHHVISNSVPLGVIDNIEAKAMAQNLPLYHGDKLLLYSDGLTEAWSEHDEEFGSERLDQAIIESRGQNTFAHVLARLDDFCGTHEQADDVTLIEVECVPGLLPALHEQANAPAVVHHFDSRGDWEYAFNLKGRRLAETNPVPILINQIIEMEGIENERQSLFTVLTELYVNALDHGVLGLESSLKSDPAGFAEYFRLREQRLKELDSGYVAFRITLEQYDIGRSMMIEVEDSGRGFNFNAHEITNADKPNQFSGRGIMLITDLCESLEFLGEGNIARAIYNWNMEHST